MQASVIQKFLRRPAVSTSKNGTMSWKPVAMSTMFSALTFWFTFQPCKYLTSMPTRWLNSTACEVCAGGGMAGARPCFTHRHCKSRARLKAFSEACPCFNTLISSAFEGDWDSYEVSWVISQSYHLDFLARVLQEDHLGFWGISFYLTCKYLMTHWLAQSKLRHPQSDLITLKCWHGLQDLLHEFRSVFFRHADWHYRCRDVLRRWWHDGMVRTCGSGMNVANLTCLHDLPIRSLPFWSAVWGDHWQLEGVRLYWHMSTSNL